MKPLKKYSRRNFCASMAALGASTLCSPVFCVRKPYAPPSGTGYAYSSDFEKFENNPFETYKRVQWINSYMAQTNVMENTVAIEPFENPLEFISKVHTQEHIDLIDKIPITSGFPLSIGQAAQTAVGYVLGAVQGVCSGMIKNAFCCIRPPGHHVQNKGEMGYCCYANVVIAARFARERFNIKKILIVDWDYHQGNGTYGFICHDNDTLFFETYRHKETFHGLAACANAHVATLVTGDLQPEDPFYGNV
jgi:acetoin utilization deacetylase AcuC-like enzyme